MPKSARCLLSLLLLTLLCLLAGPVQGQERHLPTWLQMQLNEPNTQLVAVEVYASWCVPCKAHLEDWRRLWSEYRDRGLRLAVVTLKDDIAKPPFIGDAHFMDVDGNFAALLQTPNPPAGLLWSWQGERLVTALAGNGDGSFNPAKEVEKAVRGYFSPANVSRGQIRVRLRAGEGVSAALLALVEKHLINEAKIVVVGDDKDTADAERENAKATHGRYDDAAKQEQCATGKFLAGNARLTVSRERASEGHVLRLLLVDWVKNCKQRAATVAWSKGEDDKMAFSVVRQLIDSLRRPPEFPAQDGRGPVRPAGVTMPEPAVPPERKGPRVERGAVDEGGAGKGPSVGGGEIAAAVGRLIVTVQPRDAYLEISGPKAFSATARGGWEHAKLGPGRYSVTASASGYEGKTTAATVEVDDVATVKLALERLGGLEIVGSPAGAKVEISGPEGFKESGGLPVVVRDAAKGEYTIAVSKAGYEGERYRATVRLGETARVQVGLKQPGSLVVEGTPAGAQVDITGPGGFSVTKGLPVTVEGAGRGTYRVKVTRQGYGAFEGAAEVKGGETATVSVKLVKERAWPVAGSAGASKAVGGWVRIEPGTFLMGSPGSEQGRGGEEVQRQVVITQGFWLKTKEVTQGEWTAVMGSNPSGFPACGPNCPVERVSWSDAVAYCNKMSERENLLKCYIGDLFVGLACNGYRLPTEAEWEYAARAGSTGARHGELDAVAWYDANAKSTTHPVGHKRANAWGLYDMVGNVWEWTNDWKGIYLSSATDPVGPDSGQFRVIRGGSWYLDAAHVRSAARDDAKPGSRNGYIGFRPARSVP